MIKKHNNNNQSILDNKLKEKPSINLSFIIKNKTKAAKKLKGISLKRVSSLTFITFLDKIAEIHNINNKLAKLDQIIFDKSNSVFPLTEANTFIKNSGAEVQKDTIVNPITNGDILNLSANETLQSTNKSPQLTSKYIHTIMRKKDINIKIKLDNQ
jgi:hypothetical protein